MKFVTTALALAVSITQYACASGEAEHDPAFRALMAKVETLSAEVGGLKAKVDEQSAEIASLGIKLKLENKIPMPSQGSNHVRRGLQEDVPEETPEEMFGGHDSLYHLLHKIDGIGERIQYLEMCIGYDSTNGGTCYIGDNVASVEVRPNSHAYFGTGDGSLGNDSGIKMNDEWMAVFSEGSIRMEADENVVILADNDNTGGSSAYIGLGEDSGADSGIKIADNFMSIISEGSIRAEADTNVVILADQGNTGSSVDIGSGSGQVGNETGIKITDAFLAIWSQGSIRAEADENVVILADNDNTGGSSAYIGLGEDSGADSGIKIADNFMTIISEGSIRAEADTNVVILADQGNTGSSVDIGSGSGQVGNETGIKITDAFLAIWSQGSIWAEAQNNVVILADLADDGTPYSAFLGTNVSSSGLKVTKAWTSLKSEGNVGVKADGTIRMEADKNVVILADQAPDATDYRAYIGTGDGTTGNGAYVRITDEQLDIYNRDDNNKIKFKAKCGGSNVVKNVCSI